MCPLFGGSTVYLQLPPSLSTVLTSVTSLPPLIDSYSLCDTWGLPHTHSTHLWSSRGTQNTVN